MNTKQPGDETEAAILRALVARGHGVAVPFGDNDPYDLVLDTGQHLRRIQCKTGWLENGCVRFKTYSKTTTDGDIERQEYGDDIDAFGVRCKDTGTLYWVPVEVAGTKNTFLRVTDPEIDHPSVTPATEYRLDETSF